MADLTPSERLQPCLLDRLTDDEPTRQQESREKRVMSLQRYRHAVLRDLGWLMNTSAHVAADGLDEFEEVPTSVLNFGVRDVTGLTVSGVDLGDLERRIVTAIRAFEPRVQPGSLVIKSVADTSSMTRTAISFEIRGQLWAQPIPEALFIKTEIDLETGQCELNQAG